jgi:hypothetical protein
MYLLHSLAVKLESRESFPGREAVSCHQAVDIMALVQSRQ